MRIPNCDRVTTWVVLTMGLWAGSGWAAAPRVSLEGAKLELIASEPQIMTPVGMIFDSQGRLLVIESHTHQRPDDYEGPAGDRIRMLSDSDGDGKLDKWSTFAEGFRHSMNLLAAGPGQVYLVTRRSVVLLMDEDNDGRCDRQESILQLETEDDYPHNALGGIVWDGDGGLFVGLGENHGMQYTLTGSDGISYSDHGGVGTIFRCTAEGKDLRRFCNGFWNPFSICVLPGGQVFTVDNDPDSSPPCRLIHAVETGDYGHRYEYTRAGVHPLQAWDGELPGTLPMVCGTGEAPTAVVPHRGHLWVTSWGDHRLERYRLTAKGESYAAEQKIVVQGDADFRPTGCAVAPDGSLYFADWVDRSYPVHGKGKIWRLSFAEESKSDGFPLPGVSQTIVNKTLALAQAARWNSKEAPETSLQDWLTDSNADVRMYAVRWIADDRIQTLRDDVAALLEGEIPDERYYLAVLSALEWLDDEPKMRSATLKDGLLIRELKNKSRSPKLHALALRLISPDSEFLTLKKLGEYLQADYRPLRLEAVRTLALQINPERFRVLANVAQDSKQSELVRAEAVAALAATENHSKLLATLANDTNQVVAEEASRVQRLTGQRPVASEEKPNASELAAWNKLLAGQGDAAAGRRLFFSARGARCGVCHQHGGRGGKIGPDLTQISRSNSRAQIITSILQPSREMAPHYQPWLLQTDAGKTLAVLRLHKPIGDGKELYADTEGKMIGLHRDEIEHRQVSEISIMPSGLEKTVSIDQLRDLVEFLNTKK